MLFLEKLRNEFSATVIASFLHFSKEHSIIVAFDELDISTHVELSISCAFLNWQ
jgi:hypothetical protein